MADVFSDSVLDPLILMSATQIASKIKNLDVTCVAVINAYIERIRSVNAKINAVVEDRFEEATSDARKIDTLLSSVDSRERMRLFDSQPFLGVPFTTKESFAVDGMPNCSGLVARKGYISTEDAPAIKRLRDAGAILIAVTNCSELCMWWESANRVYGRSKNPFDISRIVGGSSGGEGAILGAAGSVIGIGSDIGGSIRMPAFFNGVFGHKPSPDIVPNGGQFPRAEGQEKHYLCTGPMCRYAEDMKPMLKVLSGDNVVKLKLDKPVDIKKLRFFSIEDSIKNILVSKLDKELKEAQRYLCYKLEDEYGIKVEVLKLDKFDYSLQIWARMMATSGGKPFCHYLGNEIAPINPFCELFKAMFGLSAHTIPAIGLGLMEKLESLVPQSTTNVYVQMARDLRQEIEELLGRDGVLLYPSHPTVALRHNVPIFYPFNFAYTGIFNVLYLPVTQCPIGLSNAGLPMGVQVIASNGNDHLTLAVAEQIEKITGGWEKMCSDKQCSNK